MFVIPVVAFVAAYIFVSSYLTRGKQDDFSVRGSSDTPQTGIRVD
jgi:hypothetical protein